MLESDLSPPESKKCRPSTNVYLVGEENHQIVGTKLPSNRQILSVFFFNTRTAKLSVRESATLAVDEVFIFWKKARLPTRQSQNCVAKLLKLYQEWDKIRKNSNRKASKQQVMKEANFCETLDDLFDIAHANALEIINIPEDREFLLNQREKGRIGDIIGINGFLEQQEKSRQNRFELHQRRKYKSDEYSTKASMYVKQLLNICCFIFYYFFINLDEIGILIDSDENSDTESEISARREKEKSSEDDSDSASLPSNAPVRTKSKKGTIDFITPRLLAALDKCKISDRSAIHLITATAEALGHRTADLIINRSTIRRCRRMNREATFKEIKESFKVRNYIENMTYLEIKISLKK